jgi:hypothetical protein
VALNESFTAHTTRASPIKKTKFQPIALTLDGETVFEEVVAALPELP